VKSRNRQSLQENGVKKEANVFLNCEAEIVQEHEEMEGDINNEIIVDGEDSDSCHHKINQLEEENRKLKVENLALKAENTLLREKLSSKPNRPTLSLDNFKEDEKIFRFYTGLPNYGTFRALFNAFGNSVNKLNYYNSGTNSEKSKDANHNKRGPKRALCPEQEFFLVLVRLRLGLLEEDLATRVSLSVQHISRICITWFDFLHNFFRLLPIWPTRSCIEETMPRCFRETYPKTRVVIDCTEFFIEKASSQSVTFSNYKHHNTAKGLIGISPAGTITFVSDLYTGRTSDKQATVECGILSLLEKGDSVMADKGFEIENVLPEGVSVNIPPFLRGKEHLSIDEELETRKIASVRIHVERAISRIKTFRILNSVFPITMASDLNKIWVICSYLTNFLPPLIVDDIS